MRLAFTTDRAIFFHVENWRHEKREALVVVVPLEFSRCIECTRFYPRVLHMQSTDYVSTLPAFRTRVKYRRAKRSIAIEFTPGAKYTP